MKYLFLFLSTTIVLTGCTSRLHDPSSCMENPDAEGKLIVIVGEKIKITEAGDVDLGMLPFSKFIAEYRVVEKVCGDYNKKNITFVAFDHYGFPGFGNYEHALLFLTTYKGDDTIYHQRYQYFPVYKTKDGRWAGSYQHMEYKIDGTGIKPEKIEFAEEVSYSIEGLTRATRQKRYPEPYYRIDKGNKKAIAVFGNYVPELFQLKKDGVLKFRGYYSKVDREIEPKVADIRDIELIELLKLTKKDSLQLLKTWHSLLKAIRENDTPAIKKMSLDSIVCSVCEGMPGDYYENNLESIDMFVDSAHVNFQKSGLWTLLEQSKLKFIVEEYPDSKPATFTLKPNEKLTIFSIFTQEEHSNSDLIFSPYHRFGFVMIDGRFIFYKMESD